MYTSSLCLHSNQWTTFLYHWNGINEIKPFPTNLSSSVYLLHCNFSHFIFIIINPFAGSGGSHTGGRQRPLTAEVDHLYKEHRLLVMIFAIIRNFGTIRQLAVLPFRSVMVLAKGLRHRGMAETASVAAWQGPGTTASAMK